MATNKFVGHWEYILRPTGGVEETGAVQIDAAANNTVIITEDPDPAGEGTTYTAALLPDFGISFIRTGSDGNRYLHTGRIVPPVPPNQRQVNGDFFHANEDESPGGLAGTWLYGWPGTGGGPPPE